MTDDEPFYSPTNKGADLSPRERTPGERVWTMTKGQRVYHAELRPGPQARCELQIFLDGGLRVAHLHPNRKWALQEAALRAETLRLRDWE